MVFLKIVKMDCNLIVHNQNMAMGVLDILRKSLLISSKNINFIIFTIITSLPLFFFLVYYDFPLQIFFLETNEILQEDPGFLQYDIVTKLKRYFFHDLTQLGFFYLVPLHLLELCMVLVIVDLASKIYRGDRGPLTLKDMVNKPIDTAKLRGTLITFLYVTFLSSCTLLGLLWLLTTCYAFSSSFISSVFNAAVFGGTFVILLTLYSAMSSVWNMSVVVSILEGIYGTDALALSSYYSRGNDWCGLLLMLVFFVWEMGLRLPCLYIGCYQRGSGIVAQSSFFCLGTALKWVVCVVYFHSCKERTLQKKVDVEAGTEVRIAVDK